MGVKYKPALGDVRNIIMTEKLQAILDDESKVLTLHGSTGNGKTMIATYKFLARVYNSARDRQTFVLAGRDITTLERRFVESNRSVFNWYPFRGRWEYKKIGVGGSRITVHTRTGAKYIYLTPFNNVSAYGRILGDTIDGFFVDEGVEADDMFLQEVMLRTIRQEWTFNIMTSNGGDPEHYFYTHIVNKSLRYDEMGVGDTPDEEKGYFEGVREKGWSYVHMGLMDNPVYTEEQIEMFHRMYPFGSFMHYSRVLGVRGFSLNSPFSSFLHDVLVDEVGRMTTMVFTVDSGGHVFARDKLDEKTDDFGKWYSEYNDGEYGTADGGHSGMLTVGFNRDFSEATVLDVYFPNHMHQNINVERMLMRVYNISNKWYGVRKPYMFVDYADPNMLSLMIDHNALVGEVRPAVKRDASIGLDEKVVVSLIQQYFMRGKLKVLNTWNNVKYLIPALRGARLESDGTMVDTRNWDSDVRDMLKYVFSSMYRLLVRE